MSWSSEFMRRQMRVEDERRRDRRDRFDRIQERRERAGQEDEAHMLELVPCGACGVEVARRSLMMTDRGAQCEDCATQADLLDQMVRPMRLLATFSIVATLSAVALAVVANAVLGGELLLSLGAAGVGMAAAGTGWSAWRRAHSLHRTEDLLEPPEPLTTSTRTIGLICMVLGALVMASLPLSWALILVRASVLG